MKLDGFAAISRDQDWRRQNWPSPKFTSAECNSSHRWVDQICRWAALGHEVPIPSIPRVHRDLVTSSFNIYKRRLFAQRQTTNTAGVGRLKCRADSWASDGRSCRSGSRYRPPVMTPCPARRAAVNPCVNWTGELSCTASVGSGYE